MTSSQKPVYWWWFQSCYGHTIHNTGKCSQCNPSKYRAFRNQIKHIIHITTTKADMQIASVYIIYQN